MHLFNIAGYSIFFHYCINRSDKQTTKKLDNNNYNNADLSELKVPLSLPYTTNWKDYERCDGEIEFNGIHYSYVKRKICNDTLYLLCLPNQAKTQMYAAKNDYLKQATDVPCGKKSNEPSAKKIAYQTEFNLRTQQYNFDVTALPVNRKNIFISSLLISRSIETTGQPPENII